MARVLQLAIRRTVEIEQGQENQLVVEKAVAVGGK